MNDEHGGWEGEGGQPQGSDLAQRQQESQDLLTFHLGGSVIGPLTPAGLLRTWNYLQNRGLGQRLSAYGFSPQGRTVYLVGPHFGERPRGLHVEGEGGTLSGLDEGGHPLTLTSRREGQVRCYLFAARSLPR